MGFVEEKMKTGSLVSNGQTSLIREMKLLKEMQDQSGTYKALNSVLWHACAGPLVSLPQVGGLVYYFPQGHSEQVAVSTRKTANSHIPNYPNLASQILCQVHNITLHADKDTDEIYAQMSLQPVNSEKDVFPIPDFGVKLCKHPNDFFCKTLTASDTSTHGGFSVPRRAAEKLFPPLDHTMQPPTQELVVRDLHFNTWIFRHIYRGQPKRHLLTTGWSLFVVTKRLRAGDSILFIRNEKSQLWVGVRRANRQQKTLPSSVLSADSMHIGVLAAAAHASANRSPFTIYYNPRACPSAFVIPLAKYHKSVYGTQVSAGMRFGTMFETEESGKRRYMGTIVGITDLDALRWPGSKWRNLQVEWDEPGFTDRPNRMSLWEIETPESRFTFPSLTSGLKRSLHPGLTGAETEWGNLIKRSLVRLPEIGYENLPYSFANLYSEQSVNIPLKPSGNMSNTIGQDMKMTRAPINQKPQHICSGNMLPETHNHPQLFLDQSAVTTSSISNPVKDFENQARISSEEPKLEPEISTDSLSQLTSTGEYSQEKLATSPMIQGHGVWPDVSQSDTISPNGLFPFLDTDEWIFYPSTCHSLPGILRSPGSMSMHGLQEPTTMFPSSHNSPLPSMAQEMLDHQLNNVRCLSQLDHLVPFPQQDQCSLGCVTHSSDKRDLSDESNNQNGSLDDFCNLKDTILQNPLDCLVGNFGSNQDIQSQITSASLAESQAFSRQDLINNSGGTSSSNMNFDDSSLLLNCSWHKVAPPVRTYTKVQKVESVGRSIDVTNFKNYDELCCAIESMFGLEGLLNDPRGSEWKLVYVDYENDVLLVGDDPWEEFVSCVRCIRILSPSEVQHMSEEGMKPLNSAAMRGGNGCI